MFFVVFCGEWCEFGFGEFVNGVEDCFVFFGGGGYGGYVYCFFLGVGFLSWLKG